MGNASALSAADQAEPFGARQVGTKPAAGNLGGFHEAFRQTVGQVRGENRGNSHPALAARGLEFSIEFLTRRRGKDVQPELERVGSVMASHGPADVKDRRAAEAEMGEEDRLATLLKSLAGGSLYRGGHVGKAQSAQRGDPLGLDANRHQGRPGLDHRVAELPGRCCSRRPWFHSRDKTCRRRPGSRGEP